MKIKNMDACLIGEEMLRLQSMEQMRGSFCHVVQETLRFPNQNQSVAKGVSCGTEWSFSLISSLHKAGVFKPRYTSSYLLLK